MCERCTEGLWDPRRGDCFALLPSNSEKRAKAETRTYSKASSETNDETILVGPFQFILACDELSTDVHFVT